MHTGQVGAGQQVAGQLAHRATGRGRTGRQHEEAAPNLYQKENVVARFARYLREEKYITSQDAGGIRRRVEYGWRVDADRAVTHPNGRLKHGVLDTLVGNATAAGYSLSRSEVKYRMQAARVYNTEAKLARILGQFDNWWELIQAGFPPVEVADDDGEPIDRRDADEKLRDAKRDLDRITNDRATRGQAPLPGLETYLPGFTPDTVGSDTIFRDAFKIDQHLREEVTSPLRRAADRAARDDRERGAKLDRLFNAAGRNLDATLAEGEAALKEQEPPLFR